MTRSFTCIICPNGCEITAEYEGDTVYAVQGAACPKGDAYVRQELTDPQRNIATSVLVEGGELPLASVRLSHPIPKKEIFRVKAKKEDKIVRSACKAWLSDKGECGTIKKEKGG